MPRSKLKATSAVVRWWVSGGEDECPHCGQVYAYELEFRCPDCDAPCCPHCKSTNADKRRVCPDCVEESTGAEGSSRG